MCKCKEEFLLENNCKYNKKTGQVILTEELERFSQMFDYKKKRTGVPVNLSGSVNEQIGSSEDILDKIRSQSPEKENGTFIKQDTKR